MIGADSDSLLLLADIDSALRGLDRAQSASDHSGSLRELQSAVQTYGSVKHLLMKLDLSAEQRSLVERKLTLLRSRIVA